MPVEEAVHTGLPPLAQVPLFSLVEAFQSVLSKSKVKLSHDIVHERITLTDRINELVDLLRVKKRIQFEEMFNDLTTRFDLVITFLAILEMTKLRMTRLHQSEPMAPIYVEFSAQVESDGEVTEGAEPSATEAAASNVADTIAPAPFDPSESESASASAPPEPHPFETIPSPPPSEEDGAATGGEDDDAADASEDPT